MDKKKNFDFFSNIISREDALKYRNNNKKEIMLTSMVDEFFVNNYFIKKNDKNLNLFDIKQIIKNNAFENVLKTFLNYNDFNYKLQIVFDFEYEGEDAEISIFDVVFFVNGVPFSAIKYSDEDLVDIPNEYGFFPVIFNFSKQNYRFKINKADELWKNCSFEEDFQVSYHLEREISRKPNYAEKILYYLFTNVDFYLKLFNIKRECCVIEQSKRKCIFVRILNWLYKK